MKLRSAETQAVAALIAVGLADRATLGADPAVAEELLETLLERGELLTQGTRVSARHAMRPGRLPCSLDGHQSREHCQALGLRHPGMASRPALGSALDRPEVSVVTPRVARPIRPIGPGVEPQLPGVHSGLVYHLQLNTPQPPALLIIQSGGIAREDHLAGQRLQQPQHLEVVAIFIAEAAPPARTTPRMQTRCVAVPEFRPLIGKTHQEPVPAAVTQVHRILARRPLQCALVAVDSDLAQRWVPALHECSAARATLDIGVVQGHNSDEHLIQLRCLRGSRLRAPPGRTRCLPNMRLQRRIKCLRCHLSGRTRGSVSACAVTSREKLGWTE